MACYLFKCFHWHLFVSALDAYASNTYYLFRSDYLWLLSMLMTSPLVVTLGISLTVSG